MRYKLYVSVGKSKACVKNQDGSVLSISGSCPIDKGTVSQYILSYELVHSPLIYDKFLYLTLGFEHHLVT